MNTNESDKNAVIYRMLAEALFENYESIYDINAQTNAYKTYFQSDSYQELKLSKEGSDFFEALPVGIHRALVPEDRRYVSQMLNKETLLAKLYKEKYCRLVYRVCREDQTVYYQLRATLQKAGDGMHILMGIKNIDDLVKLQIEHKNTVESMRQKESTYLEAVLATAAAYLEANLTQNQVLEVALGHQEDVRHQIKALPSVFEISTYDDVQQWIGKNLVVANSEMYFKTSNRDYLTDCDLRGDKRASVSFSVLSKKGESLPCKAFFFLYRERSTRDLHVLCVIYDLTEQQKKEKEIRKMEEELSMSRIRNSTSQMQPHFLYNALGSIQELILIEPQYASDLLGDFMVHLRSCVSAMSSDKPIPFSEELKNIQAYVNIEKMRLGEKLDMVYDIDVDDFPVLPLCIQPLVENAIRHGIHKRGKAGGRVSLRTRSEKDAWVTTVEDTGIGFDAEKIRTEVNQGKRDSTGLSNISFRLEKVMNAVMEIDSTPGSGTTVTVRIPKKGRIDESDYRR